MNMFEHATRNKVRFPTTKGMISVEDLWDLPLFSRSANSVTLDQVARKLAVDLSDQEKLTSYVTTNSNDKVVRELQQKLEIVKYVIDVRRKEVEEKEKAHEKAQKLKQIRELIAHKKNEELSNKSLEELLAMLDE